jgi:hypothetical protein
VGVALAVKAGASWVGLVNWPYTDFAVMPTNERLLATLKAEANGGTRRLVER